jgi:membrane protease subunit HflC
MNAKQLAGVAIAFIALLLLVVLSGAFYTIAETEQAIITQFGKPIGDPINSPKLRVAPAVLSAGAAEAGADGTAPVVPTVVVDVREETEAGLHWKIPFLWKVNKFPKQILEWDGLSKDMPTKEKTYIQVDTYGRWRIADPLVYFQKLREERSALSRIDDILGSETRNTIAKHELIEVIRTTKDREPLKSDELVEADLSGSVGKLQPIRRGRSALEQEIFEASAAKLIDLGIELLDVRFKRINYNSSVQQQIYERMISERKQIADRFRSEGEGEAAKILGNMEKDLKEIQSVAYKEVEIIKGVADATATEIYAKAFNQSPAAAEFYEFSRTMELYGQILGGDSTVILSTDSDLFQYLKTSDPKPSKPRSLAPAKAAGGIE